ncbi:MAG: RNA methyltransferase [Clostridia bacterium]|nr:RNA methyltransferase [Clostridia bacterium]
MEKEYEKFAASDLFEGMTSIRAVLKAMDSGSSDRRILEIIYSSGRASARAKELGYLSKVANHYGFTMTERSDDEIQALAIGNSHGGILARCSPRTIPELTSLTGDFLPQNGFFVMLDGIEDPYNFGYSLRSVYAAGADGIILPKRNWLTAAGVVCRASAGASELFSLYTADPNDAVDFFKRHNYKVVCADKPNSVPIYDADLTKPIFLIVGGEKRGIRASVLEKADEIVRIDYGRDFNASLSAASASTVIAYEIFRQNR